MTTPTSTQHRNDAQIYKDQFYAAITDHDIRRFDAIGFSIERHKEIVASIKQTVPNATFECVFHIAMVEQAVELLSIIQTAPKELVR